MVIRSAGDFKGKVKVAEAGSATGDFIDKYLAHLERRDSREGATKWLMLAAMAALLWQLSNILFKSSVADVGRLIASFLALYYVAEALWTIFSKGSETSRLRFRLRTSNKEASGITAVAIRYILTGSLVLFFFRDVDGKWFAALPPMLLGVLFAAFILGRLKKKYDVMKPARSSRITEWVIFLLFVAPTIYGLRQIFNKVAVHALLLDPAKLQSLQAAGLCLAILFLAEKYTKSLRADGEISAVQRIWRRKGIGEISPDDAAKELRLIIAGASLNELISSDVNKFSKKLQALEEQEELAKEEMERYSTLQADSGGDSLIKNALRNSLQKRSVDMSHSLDDIEASCRDIQSEVQRLIEDSTFSDSETRELESSLNERCAARRASVESIKSNIERL